MGSLASLQLSSFILVGQNCIESNRQNKGKRIVGLKDRSKLNIQKRRRSDAVQSLPTTLSSRLNAAISDN